MAPATIEYDFDKSFPLANNTVLTVTEVPDCEEALLKLLERAMLRGFDTHARLTEIHLPMERFPHMDSKFWHVPIEDCGKAQVLRFFFEHGATPHPTPLRGASFSRKGRRRDHKF